LEGKLHHSQGMKYRPAFLALVGITPFVLAATTLSAADEKSPVARAQVWSPTNIPAMNLKVGPAGPGAFPFRAEVECDYLNKELSGRSPKFACMAKGDDELKVKYGFTNGEVYGEVLASRLLWALGFGADHMYSVKVICRGCPETFGGIVRENGDRVFDPAAIERKMPGAVLTDAWSWKELDVIDEESGGAPLAHRDALKLMAVFIQHTDTKPEQQRSICLGVDELPPGADCQKPFMFMQDVGVTYGRANAFNENPTGSVNLAGWSTTPVWKTATGPCVGNLPKSFTGTLDEPVISEQGRQFLAGLLQQLTDAQIRDLFEAARVTLRVREPGNPLSGFATSEEWVSAFKAKRAEIMNRRCA
jgi:hypothetical protein